MNTKHIIQTASKHLEELPGLSFDIFDIARPSSIEEAVNLARLYKIVSKVSPLVGNLIEHHAIEHLNSFNDYKIYGKWVRQDPGFPDIILDGVITPTPGFEIKTWYPFSTEITGRFKDSQSHFTHDQTYVILLAWLPEHVIYGKPLLLDVLITSGKSIAKARDNHYHNPADYLVLEPEDTSNRTKNLQQTNTSGHKFQHGAQKLIEAQRIVDSWGVGGRQYKPTKSYQNRLRTLMANYQYRLDTNYAKIDRIVHSDIEDFKTAVMGKSFYGMDIKDWLAVLSQKDEKVMAKALQKNLPI